LQLIQRLLGNGPKILVFERGATMNETRGVLSTGPCQKTQFYIWV
jgi:hypothetical protein